MKALTATRKRIRVRKNGKKAIDAQSTMNLPIGGLNRVLRSQAAFRWILPSLAAITPRYIETVLRGALAGDHILQWQLFDLMLDSWPVLSACQQELLYGIQRREIVFDPYSKEDELATDSAIEREKLVTCAILDKMNPDVTRNENALDGTIQDIMDGWFRGISVLEVLWQTIDDPDQGMITVPKSTFWAHPTTYGFTDDGVLGLADPTTTSGYGATTYPSPRRPVLYPFPEHKFLIAIHKARSGTPLGGPMLRPLAWWWCAANFSSDWLLNLAQVFGLPFRWANYAASAPDQTVNAICDMLTNMGSAGWAAFPEGTTLELKEASKAGSATPQGDLLDRADSYARSLLLGQTMTGQTLASGRGGQTFGTVEAQLKQDRLDAASYFVAEVINQQLIPAILMRNYGDTDEPPTCRFLQETIGTYQDAQRDQIISGLGLPLPYSYLRQKYAIPEPTGNEDVTEPPAKPAPISDMIPGPEGTSPIGQQPAGPPPNPKQAEVKLKAISLIKDDELFARELRKLAAQLVQSKETTDEPPDPPQEET